MATGQPEAGQAAPPAELLRELIESVRDYAIFSLDLHGIVTSWNAGARHIKGYEADEIIGSHFSRFYTLEAIERQWPQHELEVAKAQGRFEDEGWRVRKEGSRFWASVVITAMRDASGHLVGYLKITRDLTERHKHEEELAQSEKREREHAEALADAVRRMREYVAMVTHEMRNPLTPIRNAVSLMGQEPLGQGLESLRQTIDRQSAYLTRIVDDLMDVNRIEHGKFAISREPVALSDVLHRAIEASRPLIETRGHSLHIRCPEEPITLMGDSIRLTQVFVNLLNNAARYTPVGGRVSVFVETRGGQLIVRIADTGKGIAPQQLRRIFDPFTQIAQDSESLGGLGLGLALVRSIVELHGGNVEARSAGLGQGSEFVVTLPLAEPAVTPLPKLRDAPKPVRAARVLCVDNDRSVATSLARLLETMGHQAQKAFDGAAALDMAKTFRPHVVLLDISMSGMNGYEVATRLLEQQSDAPPMLVALTGWGEEHDKERAQRSGFRRHLLKPVTLEILESLVAGITTPDATPKAHA
jgi:PAS domain S-box-containing protein